MVATAEININSSGGSGSSKSDSNKILESIHKEMKSLNKAFTKGSSLESSGLGGFGGLGALAKSPGGILALLAGLSATASNQARNIEEQTGIPKEATRALPLGALNPMAGVAQFGASMAMKSPDDIMKMFDDIGKAGDKVLEWLVPQSIDEKDIRVSVEDELKIRKQIVDALRKKARSMRIGTTDPKAGVGSVITEESYARVMQEEAEKNNSFKRVIETVPGAALQYSAIFNQGDAI